MMHVETLEIIKRSATIPSMPMVASRCYELTQDPACDYRQLVHLLSSDPGITADILRMANSAMFGVTRQVSSLHQAVNLLGMKRIRNIILCRYLVQQCKCLDTELIDIRYFWRRSLTAAILAAKFADTVCPSFHDESFIGGLMAQIGVVVLAQAIPRQYAPIARCYKPHVSDDWTHAEFRMLGVTHGEISALVLEQWNFPHEVVEAARYHRDLDIDLHRSACVARLARAIGGAVSISKVLCETTDPHQAVPVCNEAMNHVGLDVRVLMEALRGIDAELKSMARVLRIAVIDGKCHERLARGLRKSFDAQTAAPA